MVKFITSYNYYFLMEIVSHVWNRAPLLRYINPRSQWHRLSPPATGASIETTDGVFANLSARPVACATEAAPALPTYNETLEDPVPPYWESQVQASWGDEVYVDGLPVGSVISVIWTAVVASMFQFVGFVVTYLLHTSHGSKAGSQLGLCVSLVNLGLASLPVKHDTDTTRLGRWIPNNPSAFDFDTNTDSKTDTFKSSLGSVLHEDSRPHSQVLVAYCLIAGGILVAVRALWDFYRVKRLEWTVTHASTNTGLAPSVAAVV